MCLWCSEGRRPSRAFQSLPPPTMTYCRARLGCVGQPVSLSQRQMLHAIVKVLWLPGFGNDLQIADALSDRHPELMGVNDARKKSPCTLPRIRLRQQVIISCEQSSAQRSGPIEQIVILQLRGAVLLRRFDIHPSALQGARYRTGDMDIHVERNAHGNLPSRRRRCRSGESFDSAASFSAWCRPFSISASNSC